MASRSTGRNTSGNKRAVKRPRLLYFFLNDQLHKKLLIDRGNDLLTAWNYSTGRIVKYNYTDTLHHHAKAFTTVQVCTLLNRGRVAIERAIIRGDIEEPPYTYGINEDRRKYKYMWREEDVLAAHKYFTSIGRGRPRKDGLVTSGYDLPTPRELRALMRDEEILYVKQGDQFIPTFRPKVWE